MQPYYCNQILSLTQTSYIVFVWKIEINWSDKLAIYYLKENPREKNESAEDVLLYYSK